MRGLLLWLSFKTAAFLSFLILFVRMWQNHWPMSMESAWDMGVAFIVQWVVIFLVLAALVLLGSALKSLLGGGRGTPSS